MSSPHYDAFQAMFPEGLTVFRGSAPINPASSDYPYVVIGGNLGDEDTETPSGEVDRLDLLLKLTYAGLSFDAVLVIVKAVRAAISGKRLIVPGWSSNIMRPKARVPITADRDVTIPDLALNPFFAVDEVPISSYR